MKLIMNQAIKHQNIHLLIVIKMEPHNLTQYDKVYFIGEDLPMKVMAINQRYAICTRALSMIHDADLLQDRVNMQAYLTFEDAYEALKDEVVYSCLDFKEMKKAPHNCWGGYDFDEQESIYQLLLDLTTGETELSRRNSVDLHIDHERTFSKNKMKQTIVLIAAASQNYVIGHDNKMLQHLPNDFKKFKNLTSGHHIIMGRKTFESLPGMLPNRTHVIITRQKDFIAPDGCIVVNSYEEALLACPQETVYVIGGGEIYTIAMKNAHKIELTIVNDALEIEGDTKFPTIDDKIFEVINYEMCKKDDTHAYSYDFITLLRKNVNDEIFNMVNDGKQKYQSHEAMIEVTNMESMSHSTVLTCTGYGENSYEAQKNCANEIDNMIAKLQEVRDSIVL